MLATAPTCSECDYTTYVEIPVLGHMVSVTSRVEETLTNFIAENDSDYPFSISGNIITSTNRGSGANNTSATYTIIAKRPFTLALEYMTSTSDSVACVTCGKTLAENPHEDGDS